MSGKTMTDFHRRAAKEHGVNDKLGMNDELEEGIDTTITPEQCSFSQNPDDDVVEDYKFLREKLRWSIAACEKVFDIALKDVAGNPSPRGVEGCSIIMKAITECTSQLFAMHKNYRAVPKHTEPEPEPEEGEDNDGKTVLKTTVNEIIEAAREDEDGGGTE